MKGCVSTDLGIITIDPEVIAKYAGKVAVECFGIVGMAAVNVKDGLVHLLKRESLTRGIQATISEENHISLNFHIIVAYGVSISAVTENLISNDILVPVSPSGTGNTFNSLINSFFASIFCAPAKNILASISTFIVFVATSLCSSLTNQ